MTTMIGRDAENRTGWNAHAIGAPGEIFTGRQVFKAARGVEEAIQSVADATKGD
jgi:hypothetical protein